MKHIQVAHRLSRRIRLVAPSLLRQTERGYLLEILLRKHAAIRDVRVVADIGSLTVHYDPAQLPEERLLAVVDAVVGNLAEAPPPKPAPPTAVADGPVQECSVAVEGMTCAS